jgi:hypothetical protein
MLRGKYAMLVHAFLQIWSNTAAARLPLDHTDLYIYKACAENLLHVNIINTATVWNLQVMLYQFNLLEIVHMDSPFTKWLSLYSIR